MHFHIQKRTNTAAFERVSTRYDSTWENDHSTVKILAYWERYGGMLRRTALEIRSSSISNSRSAITEFLVSNKAKIPLSSQCLIWYASQKQRWDKSDCAIRRDFYDSLEGVINLWTWMIIPFHSRTLLPGPYIQSYRTIITI